MKHDIVNVDNKKAFSKQSECVYISWQFKSVSCHGRFHNNNNNKNDKRKKSNSNGNVEINPKKYEQFIHTFGQQHSKCNWNWGSDENGMKSKGNGHMESEATDSTAIKTLLPSYL